MSQPARYQCWEDGTDRESAYTMIVALDDADAAGRYCDHLDSDGDRQIAAKDEVIKVWVAPERAGTARAFFVHGVLTRKYYATAVKLKPARRSSEEG